MSQRLPPGYSPRRARTTRNEPAWSLERPDGSQTEFCLVSPAALPGMAAVDASMTQQEHSVVPLRVRRIGKAARCKAPVLAQPELPLPVTPQPSESSGLRVRERRR